MTVRLSDENDLQTIESALQEAKILAEHEYFGFQVLGRALGQEESERMQRLETCLGYIRKALSTLGSQ